MTDPSPEPQPSPWQDSPWQDPTRAAVPPGEPGEAPDQGTHAAQPGFDPSGGSPDQTEAAPGQPGFTPPGQPGFTPPGQPTPAGYESPTARTDPYADPTGPAYGYGYGYPPPTYYGQPGYPPAYGPPPPNNSLAIASLTLSLLGFMCAGITAPVGAILGHVARAQIRRTGEGGDSMALTGIIVGWVLTGLGLIGIIAVIAVAVSQVGNTTGP